MLLRANAVLHSSIAAIHFSIASWLWGELGNVLRRRLAADLSSSHSFACEGGAEASKTDKVTVGGAIVDGSKLHERTLTRGLEVLETASAETRSPFATPLAVCPDINDCTRWSHAQSSSTRWSSSADLLFLGEEAPLSPLSMLLMPRTLFMSQQVGRKDERAKVLQKYCLCTETSL